MTDETKENKKEKTVARYKMIFLALLESAMRYREGYWRDELEIFGSHLLEEAGDSPSLTTFQALKRAKKMDGVILEKKMVLEKFNSQTYREIETMRKLFSSGADNTFDEYATGFGLIAEQYIDAKNTSDILTLCKAYNDGLLDELLKAIKTEKQNVQAIQGNLHVSPTEQVDIKQEGGMQ